MPEESTMTGLSIPIAWAVKAGLARTYISGMSLTSSVEATSAISRCRRANWRSSTRTAVIYTLVLGLVLMALPSLLPVELPQGFLQ